MAKIEDGGPAFPGEQSADAELVKSIRAETGLGMQDVKRLLSKHGGMSLRDWFAGQALVTGVGISGDAGDRAHYAYRIADAMLAERAKGGA